MPLFKLHLASSMSQRCEVGQLIEAVESLELLVRRNFQVDNSSLYAVVKRCISGKELGLGRRVHALAVRSGYGSHTFLANHFICMYASHGKLEEAMGVFNGVRAPSRHMWSSIILANARHGQPAEALKLYRQMRQTSLQPNSHVFVAALKACATAQDLCSGRGVHADILGTVYIFDVFVGNSLVDMYAKCGSIEEARRVFDSLPGKNVVTWTAVMAGYSRHGRGEEALALYESMQQEGVSLPNHVTFSCLLQACACAGALALPQGKKLHAEIEERGLEADALVSNRLVDMYAKCGSVDDARRVFDKLPNKDVATCTALVAGYSRSGRIEEARRLFDKLPTRDVVMWNAMIAGYGQHGLDQEALDLYGRMQQEAVTAANSITYACLLQACSRAGGLAQGRSIHLQVQERGLESDALVGNGLVSMYAKCGSLDEAQRVFDSLPNKDVVTWTAMIAGYTNSGVGTKALSLYKAMQREGVIPADAVTFTCLLQACTSVADLAMGKELHAQISRFGYEACDSCLASALIDMYSKCGSMPDAQQVFDSLPRRSMVTWSALIAGYARQGESDAVFDLFQRMTNEGVRPDGITLLSILTVCSHAGLLEKGQKLFEAMTTEYSITPASEHYSCMVDLLGRAGHLQRAMDMAKRIPCKPPIEVWRSVLGACRKWRHLELGRQAFAEAVSLYESDAAAYVLMSNIYKDACMPEAAKEVHAMRVKAQAWKVPGVSWWTDCSGVVHTFAVNDREHPAKQEIGAELETLYAKIEKEECVFCPDSVFDDSSDDGGSERLVGANALINKDSSLRGQECTR